MSRHNGFNVKNAKRLLRLLNQSVTVLQGMVLDIRREEPVEEREDRTRDDVPTRDDGRITGGTSRIDWEVKQDVIIESATGREFHTGQGSGNWNVLASCLRYHAEEGQKIGFVGTHNKLLIGDSNPHRADTVLWENPDGSYRKVQNLEIIGLDESAKMREGLAFFQQHRGSCGNLKFRDFDVIDCTQRPVITSSAGQQEAYMGLEFENIKLYPQYFTKWAFRFAGASQFKIKNVHIMGHLVEHPVYADNIQGDSEIIGLTAMHGMGRTFIQIVNRIDSWTESQGDVLIKDCTGKGCGDEQGASALSLQGHTSGKITVDNVNLTDCHGGLVVCTAPTSGNTSHLDPEGYGLTHVSMKNCVLQQTPDAQFNRTLVDIRMTKLFEMDRCHLVSESKTGIWLDSHADEKKNGRFKFLRENPSTESMKWDVPIKMKTGSPQPGVVLTDEQIDRYYSK